MYRNSELSSGQVIFFFSFFFVETVWHTLLYGNVHNSGRRKGWQQIGIIIYDSYRPKQRQYFDFNNYRWQILLRILIKIQWMKYWILSPSILYFYKIEADNFTLIHILVVQYGLNLNWAETWKSFRDVVVGWTGGKCSADKLYN